MVNPRTKPRTMPGVLELLPPEQITFQRMIDTIRHVFERFGFLPVETPAIELSEVLLTKSGGETERQVYFVQSTGARARGGEPDLALRFDLTVPLARYVAEHQANLAFPFRRYQMQRVYRGESAQRGRFREFYQCDIDVVGRDGLPLRHDAEIPAVIDRVFDELAVGAFTIRVNNRRLMRGLLDAGGIADLDLQSAVLREIDKLDKRGADAVAESLAELGLQRASVSDLMSLLGRGRVSGDDAQETLDELERHPASGEMLVTGVTEMRQVLSGIAALGVPEERFCLDLTVARGLDYYTGTVYETTLDDHPAIGSVCSGGRYDDLAGLYTTTSLPGVGISIGLTRLFWQLREAGLVGASPSPVQALVTLMDDDGWASGMQIAAGLRAAGINVEAVMQPSRLGKQLKYADRVGIRFAIIAGEDERVRGAVQLKDLRNQTQREVPIGQVAEQILREQE